MSLAGLVKAARRKFNEYYTCMDTADDAIADGDSQSICWEGGIPPALYDLAEEEDR